MASALANKLLRDSEVELSEIPKSDYADAIIELFPLTLIISSDKNEAAADAIHKLVTAMSVNDLMQLEQTLRARSPYSSESLYEWHRLKPENLIDRLGDASASVLGIASYHPNGYVREEAIKRLSPVTTGAEVPFLLLRLNDWVYEVRTAAYQAISARFRPEYCRIFLDNLYLLSRLAHAGRVDQKETLRAVHNLLLNEQCRANLFQALHSSDRFVRRESFKLAFTLPDAELKHVAGLALDDDDTAIRSWAAQTIASVLDEATLESFLDRMKQDRFMPVRRAALRVMIKLNSTDLNDALRAALLDPHASIREAARYHLKKIQPLDLADFYRQQLVAASESVLYAAISGLGVNGSRADAQLVVPFTSHERSKIRRAAIKAVAALDPDAHVDIFMKALEDEVANVSRQALKALSAKTSSLKVARVWEVFRAATRIHVKKNALSLLAKFSKWESISHLVRACCETDEDIVVMSRRAIDDWLGGFNRSFSTPTAEQVAQLKDALETCGKFIDDETQQQLRFSLRGF